MIHNTRTHTQAHTSTHKHTQALYNIRASPLGGTNECHLRRQKRNG